MGHERIAKLSFEEKQKLLKKIQSQAKPSEQAPQVKNFTNEESAEWTPPFWACASGDLVKLKHYVSLGYDISQKDIYGRSLFDVAIGAQKHIIVKYLQDNFPSVFKSSYVQRYNAFFEENTLIAFKETQNKRVPLKLVLFGDENE